MIYQICFADGPEVTLDFSEGVEWEMAGERYPIRCTQGEMTNWGPEVHCALPLPKGGVVRAGCSNHDGCGVTTPDGDWSYSRIDDGAVQLGPVRLDIDREAQEVRVTPLVEKTLIPYVVCGLAVWLVPA